MGRNLVVKHDLDAGLLVEPFSTRLETESGYYLTLSASAEREKRPIVTIFRDWLIEAVRETMNAGTKPALSATKMHVPSTTGA